jgi:hypothetical protein
VAEVWDRYKRPLFVAETGAEDDERADWFNYVCSEVNIAHDLGVPVQGICLYPILNHPGWADDRHCCNGLFDYADEQGQREVYQALAQAVLEQQPKLVESLQRIDDFQKHRSNLSFSSPMGLRFSAPTASYEPFRT